MPPDTDFEFETPPHDYVPPVALDPLLNVEPSKNGAVPVVHCLRFVPLAAFAAVEEPSAEPLLGDEEDTVLSAGGTLMFYGDGGAGKTTLEADLVMHLAAGIPWLGLDVPRPVTVAVIENEGPRGKFRMKVRRKRDAWDGPSADEQIVVLEEPWALFTFAEQTHRDALADAIAALKIDVLAAGPVSGVGMEGGGTLDEVGSFMLNLELVRAKVERPLAFILVHHENNAGDVSGAWEGKPDTLVHVQAQGHGCTRVYWRKVRWGSTLHGATWKLLWRDGETFERDEAPELTGEDVAASVLAVAREHPGASMRTVEKHARGSTERKRETRDLLLESGALVNVGTGGKFKLYVAEDPALREMRLEGGAPEAHPARTTGARDENAERASRLPLREAQEARRISGAPGEPDEGELVWR